MSNLINAFATGLQAGNTMIDAPRQRRWEDQVRNRQQTVWDQQDQNRERKLREQQMGRKFRLLQPAVARDDGTFKSPDELTRADIQTVVGVLNADEFSGWRERAGLPQISDIRVAEGDDGRVHAYMLGGDGKGPPRAADADAEDLLNSVFGYAASYVDGGTQAVMDQRRRDFGINALGGMSGGQPQGGARPQPQGLAAVAPQPQRAPQPSGGRVADPAMESTGGGLPDRVLVPLVGANTADGSRIRGVGPVGDGTYRLLLETPDGTQQEVTLDEASVTRAYSAAVQGKPAEIPAPGAQVSSRDFEGFGDMSQMAPAGRPAKPLSGGGHLGAINWQGFEDPAAEQPVEQPVEQPAEPPAHPRALRGGGFLGEVDWQRLGMNREERAAQAQDYLLGDDDPAARGPVSREGLAAGAQPVPLDPRAAEAARTARGPSRQPTPHPLSREVVEQLQAERSGRRAERDPMQSERADGLREQMTRLDNASLKDLVAGRHPGMAEMDRESLEAARQIAREELASRDRSTPRKLGEHLASAHGGKTHQLDRVRRSLEPIREGLAGALGEFRAGVTGVEPGAEQPTPEQPAPEPEASDDDWSRGITYDRLSQQGPAPAPTGQERGLGGGYGGGQGQGGYAPQAITDPQQIRALNMLMYDGQITPEQRDTALRTGQFSVPETPDSGTWVSGGDGMIFNNKSGEQQRLAGTNDVEPSVKDRLAEREAMAGLLYRGRSLEDLFPEELQVLDQLEVTSDTLGFQTLDSWAKSVGGVGTLRRTAEIQSTLNQEERWWKRVLNPSSNQQYNSVTVAHMMALDGVSASDEREVKSAADRIQQRMTKIFGGAQPNDGQTMAAASLHKMLRTHHKLSEERATEITRGLGQQFNWDPRALGELLRDPGQLAIRN